MAEPATADSSVCLKVITAATVRAVTDLVVSPEQQRYVASNAVSIAQAYFHREAWFRAVYAAGAPVGFVMLRDFSLLKRAKASPDPAPAISLWRLMIDRHHQGRGLGRQALALWWRMRGPDQVPPRCTRLTWRARMRQAPSTCRSGFDQRACPRPTARSI